MGDAVYKLADILKLARKKLKREAAMLTPAQVDAIYRRKPSKVAKGRALVRNGNEVVWEDIEKVGDYNLNGFAGKVGTIRRNRKGATRRLPNGTRRHFGPYMEGKEVLAYKLASK